MKLRDALSPEELHRLYWGEELSAEEIGAIYGVSGRGVTDYMEATNIPRRSGSEAIRVRNKKHPELAHLHLWQYNERPHPNQGKHLSDETRRKIGEANTRQVDLRMDSNLAYLAGLIYGDGYVGCNGRHYNIEISVDAPLADYCIRLLRERGLQAKRYAHGKCWRVQTSSKKLYQWLKSLRVEEELTEPCLIKAFLLGFTDAEGYVRKNRLGKPQQLIIVNTDCQLMKWARMALVELGYHATLYQYDGSQRRRQDTYVLCLNRQQEVADFINSTQRLNN